MKESDTFIEVLVKRIKTVAAYDPKDESQPAAIFWLDGDRDWEPLLPRLRQYLPVLTLGPYSQQARTGPVAWIRCMVAQVLQDRLAPNAIPVIYLPGFSVSALRNSEQRPKMLEPLAELLFRSVLWVRQDDNEWTVAGFFQSREVGLGIQMRDDTFTQKAMRRVLPALADLTIAQLHADEPWKAKDFEALVANINILIAMGESEELELKSTARWDMKLQKKNPDLEQVIVKTVGGFLNSARGGMLLIGVEDNHNVCGIEQDYLAFSKPEDRNPDAYERWLVNLLLTAYGQEFAPFIHSTFHSANERTVCKITLDPATEPAFVREKKDGKDEDIFYMRAGNSTNRVGIRTFYNYYKKRWC